MIKTAEQAFTVSFIKQAMAYGLSEAQATNLFKTASEKYANDWMAQLQPYLDQAKPYLDQAKQMAQQNPTAVGAIGGGLGGAVAGAGIAGKGNRLKGALGGGLAGAGDRKSTRLNSSHVSESRMPSSA